MDNRNFHWASTVVISIAMLNYRRVSRKRSSEASMVLAFHRRKKPVCSTVHPVRPVSSLSIPANPKDGWGAAVGLRDKGHDAMVDVYPGDPSTGLNHPSTGEFRMSL